MDDLSDKCTLLYHLLLILDPTITKYHRSIPQCTISYPPITTIVVSSLWFLSTILTDLSQPFVYSRLNNHHTAFPKQGGK